MAQNSKNSLFCPWYGGILISRLFHFIAAPPVISNFARNSETLAKIPVSCGDFVISLTPINPPLQPNPPHLSDNYIPANFAKSGMLPVLKFVVFYGCLWYNS